MIMVQKFGAVVLNGRQPLHSEVQNMSVNVKQIAVQLKHVPGTLWQMTNVLAEHGISIRALTVANSTDTSTVRLIVDNVIYASEVLKKAGFTLSFSSVLATEIPNIPGGLNHVLEILKDGNVNIDYMYAVGEKFSPYSKNVCIVFNFTDNKHAADVLAAAGIRLLGHGDLSVL